MPNNLNNSVTAKHFHFLSRPYLVKLRRLIVILLLGLILPQTTFSQQWALDNQGNRDVTSLLNVFDIDRPLNLSGMSVLDDDFSPLLNLGRDQAVTELEHLRILNCENCYPGGGVVPSVPSLKGGCYEIEGKKICF